MTVSERLRLRLLRSNVASSEIASEASFRNYIDRPSCEQLRTCSDVLSDVLSGEGHISHCDRVLRLCNLEQSSCSGEFGCRSFVKTRFEQFVFYLSSEKTCAFLYATIRPDFTEHSPARISGKSVRFDLPNYSSLKAIAKCELWWILNFDGLTFLTALVLYSQSDYLNHSNRDSDWLIVACFMRV